MAADGHTVYGLDAFTDTYDVAVKRANHELIAGNLTGFAELDVAIGPLEEAVAGVQVVVHLAATPGVRVSWGPSFREVASANVLVAGGCLPYGCPPVRARIQLLGVETPDQRSSTRRLPTAPSAPYA